MCFMQDFSDFFFAGFGAACVLEYLAGGMSPLARFGLIVPGTPISQAPGWLLVSCGALVLGALGVLSGFGKRKDPDTY
jgi:hypothetical protein